MTHLPGGLQPHWDLKGTKVPGERGDGIFRQLKLTVTGRNYKCISPGSYTLL